MATGLPHINLPWQKDRMARAGAKVIYYLERQDGAVKIGTTGNYPSRRMRLVRNHGPLNLVAWEFGYYEVEERRHQQFARLRVDPVAEWFRVDDDLMDHMLMLLALLA